MATTIGARRTTTLLVCLLVAALTGCSDEPDAVPEPSPTSSTPPTSTSSSPSPTADASLTDPPADETAEQFIRRWIELGNYMQATGDSAPFRAVIGPGCEPCLKFADKVDATYRAGGHIEGGLERLVQLTKESETTWVTVTDPEPTRLIPRPGGRVERFEGGPYRSRVFLGKVDGRWLVGTTEGLPM